jgi:hypothetical protein
MRTDLEAQVRTVKVLACLAPVLCAVLLLASDYKTDNSPESISSTRKASKPARPPTI